MKSKDNFSHSATVFCVTEINESIKFYTNKLEFDLTFSWGKPIDYAVLKKGGVNIHLTSAPESNINTSQPRAIYIFIHDIDAIYKLCKKGEIEILNQPDIRDYKMKDFDIVDLDGNKITFGNGQ